MIRRIPPTIAIAFALLLASCGTDSPDAIEKPAHPVVFIGIDGADWDVIQPMIDNGELPNLARLIDAGISGHLINPGPANSPPAWTTFVTGHFARDHGVLDHAFPFDDSKQKRPVNSTLRLKPALWNIATDYGLTSRVFGYFVTWPAETINGSIVSDRAVPGRSKNTITPVESIEAFDELFGPLRNEDNWPAELKRYFPWGYSPSQALDEEDPNHFAATQIRRRVDSLLINDEGIRRAVQRAPTDGVDLFIAYYRGPDITGHPFWKYYDDSDYEQKPDEDLKEKLGRAVPEAYRFADQAVGELMERFGDRANYIIVSDHGFRSAREKTVRSGGHEWELTGNHRLNGVLIAAGPDIATGTIDLPLSVDIMPSLAALLGLPLSDELPGSVDYRILRPDFGSDRPLNTVPAYRQPDARTGDGVADSVGQASAMEELRGLGYIGADVSLEESAERTEYAFWDSTGELVVTHISGEMVYHLLKGYPESALAALEDLRDQRPELEHETLQLTYTRLRLLRRDLPGNPEMLKPFHAFNRKFGIGWSKQTGDQGD